MKPPPFAYATAASIEQAVTLLAEHGWDAKILAGGQSLVPILNFRMMRPGILVDINRIEALDVIAEHEGGLRIGALTRHRTLETSPLVRARFPVLTEAMRHVAHLAIRNRGTIGGSLSHADPAAELPMMALLLDARIRTEAAGGGRVVAARDFFLGALTTALEPTELVTEIELPALPPGSGWEFQEFSQRVGDFAIAAVGVVIGVTDGICTHARIALIGSGTTAIRADAAEAMLIGQKLAPDRVAAVARAAAAACDFSSDLHASAEYRAHLVEVLTRRAIPRAWLRATGEMP